MAVVTPPPDTGAGKRSGRLERSLLAAVVGHPWVRRRRTWLRDAWWWIRGRWIARPVVPEAPRRLLFVCKGNICRSPFAARLAGLRLAGSAAGPVECRSAGFRVSRETKSPPQAVEACRRFGVSLDDHVSVALDEELMRSSDAVVVMEAAHHALLVRQYPGYRDRVLLLPLFAPATSGIGGHARYNITDPYGRPVRDFEACYQRIDGALDGLFAAMFGGARWRRA